MNAANPNDPDACCRQCEAVRLVHLTRIEQVMQRKFIVCPACGNKRCPKATNHELACTNSNASGQPGSDY